MTRKELNEPSALLSRRRVLSCHLAEHGQLFYSVPAVEIRSKPTPSKKATLLPLIPSGVSKSHSQASGNGRAVEFGAKFNPELILGNRGANLPFPKYTSSSH